MRFLKAILIPAFMAMGIFAHAQSSRADTIKMLCQKWKIKEADKVPIDDDLKEEWDYSVKNSRTEFKTDMKYIGTNGEDSETGTWSLDRSGKVLTIFQKGEDPLKWTLLSLSFSILKIKEEIPELKDAVTITFISTKK